MPAILIQKGAYSFGTKQHDGVRKAIPEFLKRVEPDRIIEIGSLNFGFTALLSDHFDGEIVSYEIDLSKSTQHNNLLLAGGTNVEAKFKSAFDDYKFIEEFIQREGRTLVFCDGGNKIKEFIELSDFLKSGDVICAHDFKNTNKKYNRPKWTVEITDVDIQEAIDKHELVEYEADLMLPVVWGSYQKP